VSQYVFDESLLEKLETLYRTRDVLRRRRIVREALAVQPGERVLDAGCGPGFYVVELLEQVGPSGAVVGVDISPQMLEAAARRAAGHANAEFQQAGVTSLPAADTSFDAALSVQVLEYVPDTAAALTELHRVLRPGGRVLVWDVDWSTLSMHSSDPGRMERVLRAWDGHLTHPALPRTLAPQLRAAGFDQVEMAGHSFATAELVPDAYGASFVPLIEQFVPGIEGVTANEARAWAVEQRELGEQGAFFFACIQFCFTAKRRA
jgi:ubiquinone/menaquinone biosynthesis C-methylase UbiE